MQAENACTTNQPCEIPLCGGSKAAISQGQVVTFTALPGGNRNNNGTFNNVGNNGNWWSATENNATNAWNRNLNYNNTDVNRNNNNKENGFSVRCLRDLMGSPCSNISCMGSLPNRKFIKPGQDGICRRLAGGADAILAGWMNEMPSLRAGIYKIIAAWMCVTNAFF